LKEKMGRPSDPLLVIEGGGSKGRAALAWEGRIMARCLPMGLNPNDVEPELFRLRLGSLILPLIDLPERQIRSLRVVAAFAGAGRPEARQVCQLALLSLLGRRPRIKVTSDAEALLDRFLARRDGVVLIAGTGSVCLGVKRVGGRKTVARAGGWGAYFDRGCGFSLGAKVLDSALGALEGRTPRTPVVDLLCARYGVKLGQVPDLFLPIRRGQVADLARIVLQASAAGDTGARRLVRDAISDLAGMVRVVVSRLSLAGPFDVVIAGGIFENRHLLRSFGPLLKRRMPRATLIHVKDPLACLVGSHPIA
jgi:N-acetylglucosamine kinase-like BadF-type ATPase